MTTDERLDRIDNSIQNLTRYVLELRAETSHRLEIIESRLDVLIGTIASLDSRMAPLTKAIMDFGVIATRLQIEQSRIAKLVEPAA